LATGSEGCFGATSLYAWPDYLTRVRRRWIKTTSTMTNRTAEMARMRVVLSMVNPFRSTTVLKCYLVLPVQVSSAAEAGPYLTGMMVPASEAHEDRESAAGQPQRRS
jgi:hypothetical protein